MNRRAFLGALATGGAVTGLAAHGGRFASGHADSTRERPWVVRYVGREGMAFGRGHMRDAMTGEDVSVRFPYNSAYRVERALRSGRPMRLALFALNASGHHYVFGSRVAMEWAWTKVIG